MARTSRTQATPCGLPVRTAVTLAFMSRDIESRGSNATMSPTFGADIADLTDQADGSDHAGQRDCGHREEDGANATEFAFARFVLMCAHTVSHSLAARRSPVRTQYRL